MSQEIRNEAQRIKPSILEYHENKCYVCHYDCVHILVVHHIIPVSEGGTNELSNLIVLCPNCHALVHKMQELSGKTALHDVSPACFRLHTWYVHNLPKEQIDRLTEIANGNRTTQRRTQETARPETPPIERGDLW